MSLLETLSKVPVRAYEYAGLAALLLSAGAFWTHHERAIGADRLQAKIDEEHTKIQARIDSHADEENARIDARFNSHVYAPIDFTLPSSCPDRVPDDVRDRVNKAHH